MFLSIFSIIKKYKRSHFQYNCYTNDLQVTHYDVTREQYLNHRQPTHHCKYKNCPCDSYAIYHTISQFCLYPHYKNEPMSQSMPYAAKPARSIKSDTIFINLIWTLNIMQITSVCRDLHKPDVTVEMYVPFTTPIKSELYH